MMHESIRLDAWLVQRGIASARDKAKALIADGFILVDGRVVTKPAFAVNKSMTVVCSAPTERFVGRGGYKLEKALDAYPVSLNGAVCLDVGASTGGFTDCMLQHGAARVYAVDVGHDQLHPTLRDDSRVMSLEGVDVRSEALAQTVQPGSVIFCSVDVSFVSLAHVLPAVVPYLAPDATMVCLIKPQFEAGVGSIGKRGVVKDKKAHMRVLQNQLALFDSLGLSVALLTFSPITGGEGNIEYLAVLCRENLPTVADVAAVVDAAHTALK